MKTIKCLVFLFVCCALFPDTGFSQEKTDKTTSIVYFENTMDFAVDIQNGETGQKITLGPKREKDHVATTKMNIPTCNTQGEFGRFHILITIKDLRHPRTFSVWKRNDFVLVSTDGWQDPGKKIQGESKAGGDLKWVIRQDGPHSYPAVASKATK